MTMIAERLISFAIGYGCGLILLGYILGRLSHVDLRSEGSGNVGSTNTTRVLGAKKGLMTLICDVGKGFLATGIVWLLFHARADLTPEDVRLLMIYAAFGAVIGHDFPFYMGFRGGKGVATSLSFLTVADWRALLVAVFWFVLAFVFTRYVSLGSILGAVFVLVFEFVLGGIKIYAVEGARMEYEVGAMIAVAASILLFRHRENFMRLIKGEESRFSIGHGKSG